MYQLSKKEKKQIKNLVEIIDNDLFTGTYKLSILFELHHKSLKKLIERYRLDFEDVGEIEVKTRSISGISNTRNSSKKGRPETEYLLNEPQAAFLILISKNKELVLKFKKHITKEFFNQRKKIIKLQCQLKNAEWQKLREEGKLDRKIETDSIKKFIEYATNQGSKNANKYYMIISKMEYITLFNIELLEQKFPNIRNLLNRYQLVTLQNADKIIARTLEEGINKKMFYKEIYKLAKARIESFVDLVGKSRILEDINQIK